MNSMNILVPFCSINDKNCANSQFLYRLFLNNASNFIRVNNHYMVQLNNTHFIKKFILDDNIYLIMSNNNKPVIEDSDKILDVKELKTYDITEPLKNNAVFSSADDFKRDFGFFVKYMKYKTKYLNLLK